MTMLLTRVVAVHGDALESDGAGLSEKRTHRHQMLVLVLLPQTEE